MKAAIFRMIISAVIAGVLAGVLAWQGGSTGKAAILTGIIMLLKDVQSGLSQSPQEAAKQTAREEKGIPNG